MIVYSTEKYLPHLRSMWSYCFPDTGEFIALYFSKIYKEGQTLIYLEDDVPVASLQMIPYQIKLQHEMYQAAYISGAMTHPVYRRKGYMEQLLLFAFEEMKKNNFSISFLIPQEDWLFDFYSRFGFQKAFPKVQSVQDIPRDVISDMKSFPLSNTMMDVSYLYRSLLAKKENVVLKTEQQVKNIIEDVMMDGGKIFLNPFGIAFVYYRDGKVSVRELLAETGRSRYSLLHSISDYYHVDEITLYQYIPQQQGQFYGMIKSLNDIPLPSDIYMSMMLD